MWIFKSILTTIRFSTLCFKNCHKIKKWQFFLIFFSISTFYSIWERVRERERENITTFFPLIFLSTTFQLCPLKFFFSCLWHHYFFLRKGESGGRGRLLLCQAPPWTSLTAAIKEVKMLIKVKAEVLIIFKYFTDL